MSPIVRLCPKPGCGRTDPHTHLDAHDQARRTAKTKASGRGRAAWHRLRQATIARDGCCTVCGTTHDLTVHLHPSLNGNHWLAGLDHVTTLCRSCHGRLDAPRASRP